MGLGVRRGVAAVAGVAVAAAVNVATGMLTQHWAVAWWVATGVLVVVGGGLQWWLTPAGESGGSGAVSASGAGAVAVGGSVPGMIATGGDGATITQKQQTLPPPTPVSGVEAPPVW